MLLTPHWHSEQCRGSSRDLKPRLAIKEIYWLLSLLGYHFENIFKSSKDKSHIYVIDIKKNRSAEALMRFWMSSSVFN